MSDFLLLQELNNKLDNMVKQFRKFLFLYYKYSCPKNNDVAINLLVLDQLDVIFKTREDDIFLQYSSILKWCNRIAEKDEFKVIKKAFINLHKKMFSDRLHVRAEAQAEIMKKLRCEAQQLEKNYAANIASVNQQISLHRGYLKRLQQRAQCIANETFPQRQNHAEFQQTVMRLKKVANSVRFCSLGACAQPMLPHDAPHCPKLITTRKESILQQLSKNIKAYKEQIKQEGVFTKMIKWFSFARRRRTKAIEMYEQQVHKLKDSDSCFDAAIKWLNDQISQSEFKSGNKQSRFYQKCIAPFVSANKQLIFEKLPALEHENQSEIDAFVGTIQENTKAYNRQLEELKSILPKLGLESQQLDHAINGFITSIDSLKDDGFGYPQNNASTILQTMTSISVYIEQINKNKRLEDARILAEDIGNIHRQTPQVEITQLANRFAIIKKDPHASAIIESAVNHILQNTIQDGGPGKHFCFKMGALQVEMIVNIFGTPKQRKRFQEVKPKILEKVKQAYKRVECDLVNLLRREIEIGTLQRKLMCWREAYLKHKKLEGHLPDAQSEKIYKQEIQPAHDAALRLHFHNGAGELAQFIKEVISATRNASCFNKTAKAEATPIELLSWESVEMLVTIYGTREQICNWNQISPSIRENLGWVKSNSAMESLAVGLSR